MKPNTGKTVEEQKKDRKKAAFKIFFCEGVKQMTEVTCAFFFSVYVCVDVCVQTVSGTLAVDTRLSPSRQSELLHERDANQTAASEDERKRS